MKTSIPDPPLYRTVLDRLRAEMRDGVLPVGAALPSEKALCDRFGVSRITVRRALDELAQAGLVQRSAGRAARVTAPRLVQAVAAFEDSAGSLHFVRDTHVRLLDFAWRIAEEPVAQALGLQPEDQILCITRLRTQAETPVFHAVTHLPAAIGARVNRRALEGSTLHDVLAAAGHLTARTERQMGAAPCPKEIAAPLGLRSGAPTLRMERLSRDAEGRPLHLTVGHWRWDRFSLRLVSDVAEGGGHLTIREIETEGEGVDGV